MAAQQQDSGPTLDRRFKLGKVIGRGPSGVVYTATDLEKNQPCAVKRLHAHFYNRQVLERVQRDALAAAKLGHPGILAPYHVAFEQSGSIYLVTQLVQGESLLTRLQRGPLSLTAALMLIDPLAAALHAAHEFGLYHGAITPTNVLCVTSGKVVLSDFGMCHLRATPKIKWGGAMGYAAPETFADGAELCSARADVFSLGALAFECLTGQRMFSSTSVATFLASVSTPPRLGELLPMYEHLDAVLEMACIQEPEDRFANAGALWRALQSSLLDVPESIEDAPPVGSSQTARAVSAPASAISATPRAEIWEAAAWETAAAGENRDLKSAVSHSVPESKAKNPVQAMSILSVPVGESSDSIHPVPLPPPPAIPPPLKAPIRVHEAGISRITKVPPGKAPQPPQPQPPQPKIPQSLTETATGQSLRTTLPKGIPGKVATGTSEPHKVGETHGGASAVPVALPSAPLSAPEVAILEQGASSRARHPTPRLPQLSPAPLPPTPSVAAAGPPLDVPAAPVLGLPVHNQVTPAMGVVASQLAAQTLPTPASGIAIQSAFTNAKQAEAVGGVQTRPMPILPAAQTPPAAKPVLPARPAAPKKNSPAPKVPTLPGVVGLTPVPLTPRAGASVTETPSGLLALHPARPAAPAVGEQPPTAPSHSVSRSRPRFSDRVLLPLFWATLGGCIVGGTMLLLQWLGPERSGSFGSAGSAIASLHFDEDALLKVTQQHLAQRNYQEALSAAELILSTHPDNARARRLADQSSELLRASAVYGGFLRAADQQDADTAVALYFELPADSPFRVNAWEPYMPVRSMFVSRHLGLANAALASGDCDMVAQQIDELRRIAENERDPDLTQGHRLLSRCRRVFGMGNFAASAVPAAALPEPASPSEVPGAAAGDNPRSSTKGQDAEPVATARGQAPPAVVAEKPRKSSRKKSAPKAVSDTDSGASAPSKEVPEKVMPAGLRNPFGS